MRHTDKSPQAWRLIVALGIFMTLAGQVFPVRGEWIKWRDQSLEFETRLTHYNREYKGMIKLRGLDTGTVQTRSDDVRIAMAYYPESVAAIFYHYDETVGCLEVWRIDHSGIWADGKTEISKDKLGDLIWGLRRELKVDLLQADRMPRSNATSAEPRKEPAGSSEKILQELTSILLPEKTAKAIGSAEHLMIVPTLDVGTVPFAALRPWGDDTFLIDRMSVSVIPGFSAMIDSIEEYGFRGISGVYSKVRFTAERPLVVGNPFFGKDPDFFIPQLPGAESEAKAVAELMHTTALTGVEATKENVLERARTSDILYFATHGMADAEDPMDHSFILLAADQGGRPGRWTAREIQNTRVKADLAVLSACQTGLGMGHNAGVVGLTRAFQLAGTPHVVMSLWSVDDFATAYLMQRLVKNLKTAQPFFPATALRQAMLQTRDLYPEPAKWASFALFGNPY